MNIVSLITPDCNDSAWERIENYIKEERPLQPISKLVVKGSVDVVFRRSEKPMLVVAGETAEAVKSVKTDITNGKLVIEREGMTLNFGNSQMVFHGATVGSFVMGDIVNGKPMGTVIGQGKVVVGIGLSEAPVVKITGSGDVTLIDLRQYGLEIEIQGSGDVTAYGAVTNLNVRIAGSGDVDANELITETADLSVAGSGDIEAFVKSEVQARVAGSGDIVVRGNPPRRNHSVAGSGKIKFR